MNKLLGAVVILLSLVVLYQLRTIVQLRKTAENSLPGAVEARVSDMGEGRAEGPPQLAEKQLEDAADGLRSQNESLQTRVAEFEARLAAFEPFMPGLEDPRTAYFGPGRWITGERRGLAQVVVAGSGNNLTVQVWGHASPPGEELVPWPELPLCKISYAQLPNSYWRGLAEWPGLDNTELLLLTFEREGLRVDWLRVPKLGSNLSCALIVTKLKRAGDNP